MENTLNRDFNCKNEELPIISHFVALSLERDLNLFANYSPVFNETYLNGYKAQIQAAEELVSPRSETVELKLITERAYATLDGLITPINYLEGYISLAKKEIPVSLSDFGLVPLRKSVRSRDIENVLTLLRRVLANIDKYKTELTSKGLNALTTDKFSDALSSLANDKNRKYSILSNRAALVQSNMNQLNELNRQLTEICDIGKVLFKQTDPAKLKDYTFSQLIKKVRRTDKPDSDKEDKETAENPRESPIES